jgi:hypothetical protein
MPTVTGTLRDVGLTYMPGRAARLKFQPTAPGIGQVGMVTTAAKFVNPSATDGSFSVNLVETGFVWRQGVPISIRVSAVWLDPDDPSGTGFDQFLMDLEVPAAGGSIGDLAVISTGNDVVYTSPTAKDPNVYSGFQMNTTTGDLYKRMD